MGFEQFSKVQSFEEMAAAEETQDTAPETTETVEEVKAEEATTDNVDAPKTE
jgi:hypothetical protein